MSNYVIVHVPHASTELPFPEHYTGDVSTELALVTDWATDRMAKADESVVFPFSRLWCDVERFIDDPLNDRGLGMFTTHRLNGDMLREAKEPYIDLVRSNYLDHHDKVAKAVTRAISLMPVCLLDMHSYSDQQAKLIGHSEPYPEICLGYGQDVSPGLVQSISLLFKGSGYSVGSNQPYQGALIPSAFEGHPDFFGLMLEVNKSVYLGDNNSIIFARFKKLQDVIARAVDTIRNWSNDA